MGFAGADLILAPVEHLAFDLQANYVSVSTSSGTATGYAFVPMVQGRLLGGQKSTPYMGVGWGHISMSLNGVTASGSAVFANLGYEWRWDQGLGILLGGGVAHLNTLSATDGITSVTKEGGWFPNLEFSIRYMFL
jgi:hypothetical protein